MIHVGDITKLNGAELPVVDVITGGSPCQDLSVAGKRAGLAGERSGLFMEQVRIVKEMREHDRSTGRTGYLTRPRYMLWENVPGAFSSNKGEDFRAVLEEIAKVEQEDAHIPRPEGSWPYAGCVMGDGWSIAWRLHDAQFWGVPQRRKRIALVADFGGQSVPEILFERKGMRRDPEESGEEREGTSSDVKGSVAATISCLNDHGGSQMGVTEDVTGTLRAQEHGHQPLVFEPGAASRVGGHVYENDVAGTVRANAGDNQPAIAFTTEITPKIDESGTAFSLRSRDYKDPQSVVYGISAEEVASTMTSVSAHNAFDSGETRTPTVIVDNKKTVYDWHRCDTRMTELGDTCNTMSASWGAGGNNMPYVLEAIGGEVAGTIDASYYKGRGERNGKEREVIATESIVRRLTPLECERLQGFQDGWTDIGEWTDSKGKMRKCSDSARYKALGNSIAIPFWFYILRRMAAQYERPATLGSLFDGIGGFPLCWERCNGKGTAIWASEIEEFAIAVTKKRFGDR